MGFRGPILGFLLIACANAQLYRVCVPPSESLRCQNMNVDGSQVQCVSVETRVECAAKLAKGTVDFGVFSEEELLLLAQQNPSDHRVLATIRDVNRMEPYSFEAVAVVSSNHTNGLEGLRGGRYCHPGLGVADLRWSPRVLKALETAAARTDRCEGNTDGKTVEELEVENLSGFFSAACRPGPWSTNATVDANLKSRFPNLCSMCTGAGTCAGYSSDTTVNVAGVLNTNRHIQALDCLATNGTVAYVAWQHVREFFTVRNPTDSSRFSLLCENGTVVPLTADILNTPSSPCAFVRQPWRAIVAVTSRAEVLQTAMRGWWPLGSDTGTGSWLNNLYLVLAGGANARLVYHDTLQTPLDYTAAIRPIASIDSTAGCLPARRWCTTSAAELDKCSWLRTAAYSLGLQPAVSCQQRASVFECLADVRDQRADFFTADTHYGYIARQHFRLSAVKLVQNHRSSSSRIAALVKDSATSNITRFENLRDKTACFPEFGGLAYVAFLRHAQEVGIISANECDYARAVGEFFNSACAPGALDATHSISAPSDYNATNLCAACRPNVNIAGNNTMDNFTCAWDNTNQFFGNNGSLLCLADPNTDVAFVELQNINDQLRAVGVQGSSFRALCANNTLALTNGTTVDDGCLIAHVVDAEVLMRRNCQMYNSVNVLLDTLDQFFGYNVAAAEQLINLHIYSAFDGVSDLLFKDTTVGLTEPTTDPANPTTASNYINLFGHLETCTNSVAPLPDSVSRTLFSVVTLFVTAMMALIV